MYTYLLQLFTTANQKSSRSYRSYLTIVSDQQQQLQQQKNEEKQHNKTEKFTHGNSYLQVFHKQQELRK